MKNLIGKVLGRCYLEALLGEGSMAIVYRGMHQTLGIPVAVKVLKTDTLTQQNAHYVSYRDRFRREAQLAARLGHDGIVRVLDFGEDQGVLYLVMEYVHGYSLQEYLRKAGTVGEEMAVNIISYLASALAVAHGQHVIHRDLKPANVLVTHEGWLKIADLGLAKELGVKDLTNANTIMGTPTYMAPECFIAGKEPGPGADIYSLGVILYEMVAGRAPFSGTLNQVISGHLHAEPDWNLESGGVVKPMPAGFVNLLKALLAKKPEIRPKTCAEVMDLCQARLRELGAGAPQAAGGGAKSGADKNSESSTFHKLNQFMERNLGSRSSEYQGHKVMHTSQRERVVVWVLLILFVGGFIAAYIYLS